MGSRDLVDVMGHVRKRGSLVEAAVDVVVAVTMALAKKDLDEDEPVL